MLLPAIVIVSGILWTRTSLSAIREPESIGFLTLYCIAAGVLHVSPIVVLNLFAHAVKRSSVRAVWGWYLLALVAMSLSGLYYAKWFISVPTTKYIPLIVYLAFCVPLLSLGVQTAHRNSDANVVGSQ